MCRVHFDQALQRGLVPAQVGCAAAHMQCDDDIFAAVVRVQIVGVRQIGVDVAVVGDKFVAAAPQLGLVTGEIQVAVAAEAGRRRPFDADP